MNKVILTIKFVIAFFLIVISMIYFNSFFFGSYLPALNLQNTLSSSGLHSLEIVKHVYSIIAYFMLVSLIIMYIILLLREEPNDSFIGRETYSNNYSSNNYEPPPDMEDYE